MCSGNYLQDCGCITVQTSYRSVVTYELAKLQSFDMWPISSLLVCNQGNHSVINVLFFQ